MSKKIVGVITALIIMIFVVLFMVPTALAKDKVKIYIFEAGGCPYCEAEIEYLESLESYNKKFEIIRKELYEDHVDWKKGEDYELGKKVAELFLEAGFEDADYQATPFVVISDVYAAASYNTDLEAYIDKAYENGDNDIVKCVESNSESCNISGVDVDIINSVEKYDSEVKEETKKDNKNSIILIGMLSFFVLGLGSLIFISLKK